MSGAFKSASDVDDDTARTELARRLLEEYLNGLRAILSDLRRKLN